MPCVTPFGLRTGSRPFNDGLNRYRGCDAKRRFVDAESEVHLLKDLLESEHIGAKRMPQSDARPTLMLLTWLLSLN